MHPRFGAAFLVAGLSVLSSCALKDVGPINTHVAEAGRASSEYIPDPADDGSTVVGLAISGGGMRAAAFGYGVLHGLDEVVIDNYPERRTLIDDIRMISGTSGGAVTAAYFGYKGENYVDFKERFLLANPEKALHKSKLSPVNWAHVYSGGANDRSTFANWLNENLFDGKTYASFRRSDAPIVWINASDIYHGTPFDFTYDTFAALCSDLDAVRIADAVAASAAFPVVFAPLVVSTTMPSTRCGYEQPEWLADALANPAASIRLKAYARALDTYQNEDRVGFIKLLDGGLTDNIGITGFSLEREAAKSPHGPLSAEEAVKMKTFIFLVADASVRQHSSWLEALEGPTLPQMVGAISSTAIRSSVRDAYDALRLSVDLWRDQLIKWRCGLPRETVRKLRGTLDGWNCRDLTMLVEDVSFEEFPEPLRDKLNAVPTRLKLSPEQVDLVVDAGIQSVRDNALLQKAFQRIQRQNGIAPLVASRD